MNIFNKNNDKDLDERDDITKGEDGEYYLGGEYFYDVPEKLYGIFKYLTDNGIDCQISNYVYGENTKSQASGYYFCAFPSGDYEKTFDKPLHLIEAEQERNKETVNLTRYTKKIYGTNVGFRNIESVVADEARKFAEMNNYVDAICKDYGLEKPDKINIRFYEHIKHEYDEILNGKDDTEFKKYVQGMFNNKRLWELTVSDKLDGRSVNELDNDIVRPSVMMEQDATGISKLQLLGGKTDKFIENCKAIDENFTYFRADNEIVFRNSDKLLVQDALTVTYFEDFIDSPFEFARRQNFEFASIEIPLKYAEFTLKELNRTGFPVNARFVSSSDFDVDLGNIQFDTSFAGEEFFEKVIAPSIQYDLNEYNKFDNIKDVVKENRRELLKKKDENDLKAIREKDVLDIPRQAREEGR